MQQVHHQLFSQVMQSVLVCLAAAAVVTVCRTQGFAVLWETGGLGWYTACWVKGRMVTHADISKGTLLPAV